MIEKRLFVLAAFLLFLSGCATQPLSLKKEASQKINSVQQVLLVPQNNLDVTVTPGNPGGSGIIGALIIAAIDEARRSSAKDQAQPIIEELKGYDFRKTIFEALSSEIANSGSAPYQIRTELDIVDSDSNRWAHFEKATSDAVLYTHVSYRLNEGKLIVEASLEMYPRSNSLYPYREKPNEDSRLDKGNMIYRKNFKYERQGVSVSDVKSGLNEAASNISSQIVIDLNHPI